MNYSVSFEQLRGEVARVRRKGRAPRVHPNGFVQLDLMPHCRLHVWPAEPLAAQKTRHPIHDHPFDMASFILKGQMVNLTYQAVPFDYGKYCDDKDAYVLHRVQSIGGKDTVLEPQDGVYTLETSKIEEVDAGQSYELARYVLHDSVAHGLTATLMLKTFIDRDYKPLVAVPLGVQPDNEYRREQFDEQQLWGYIEQALG